MNRTETLELITPLFSRGMTDQPEIRAPSIRGQLHWWFRAIGGKWEDEAAIFGRIGKQNEVQASRLVVRVSDIQGRTGEADTLPHKDNPHHCAPKTCYLPGTRFKVHFITRLAPLRHDLMRQLQDTIEVWLLAGSLGLRATRGAGAFKWAGCPYDTEADFVARLEQLTGTANGVRIVTLPNFSDTPNPSPEELRYFASDTIGGRFDREGEDSLRRMQYPLGAMRPRKTSPLRFRPALIGTTYHLLAIWDGRMAVSRNSDQHLRDVISALVRKNKQVGYLLQNSPLAG
jgi:hypothetical protein